MFLSPHRLEVQIRNILMTIPKEPWSGRAFRCVRPSFASAENLLNGKGAFFTGGRWNPPMLFNANYCSLTPGTAAEEAYRLFEEKGIPRTAVGKRIIIPIHYELHAVWNCSQLLDSSLQKILETALCENWAHFNERGHESLGQCLGRSAYELDLEGLLMPSARVANNFNLVTFPENFLEESFAFIEE